MADVSLRGISVAFQAISVFDQLDLEVERGEFLVLLGPSGCGKSTLLNAIAGLLDVATGQIWIGGRNVTWEEPKDRGIAMVFQSYALYPRMSVRKNMSFGLRMAKTPKDEIERRVAKAAGMLQIDHLLDRRPDQLSGGQRQRVAIGRAMVRDADVFLFDEPLSNLDAQLRNELRVEIKRLHQQLGATMIYVTHDQIEALTLADRVAVMKDLKIQQLAPPHEIYHRPANRFVAGFVGSPRMNFVEGWLEATDQGGWLFSNGTHHLPLPDYPFERPPSQHQEVTLGIRPEHLQPAEAGVWTGFLVEMTEPMGADMLVWVRSGPDLLSIRTESDRRIAVGERLALHLPVDRVSLFAQDDGRRL
ncbi:ABC transporter ATP-binding protein [Geminicoccus roseus]|uniref:ABC transporter ATP-binding protein n=1 Tax=Geminicoccus roseus TaxID=404900 RepID=UPI000412B1A2|nr:ABC transporter ATP-binding protein [Geminicoccus roseus]